MMFNNPLRQPAFAGLTVEQKLASYEDAYVKILESVQSGDAQGISMCRDILKGFGVTHLVFGVHERRIFPRLSAEAIAAALTEPLLFSGREETGVIRFN